MSGSNPPVQLLPPQQSQALVLSPGIVGLFIQGIETGLVFSQFYQWFSASDRSKSPTLSIVVVFVTVVGLCVSSRL